MKLLAILLQASAPGSASNGSSGSSLLVVMISLLVLLAVGAAYFLPKKTKLGIPTQYSKLIGIGSVNLAYSILIAVVSKSFDECGGLETLLSVIINGDVWGSVKTIVDIAWVMGLASVGIVAYVIIQGRKKNVGRKQNPAYSDNCLYHILNTYPVVCLRNRLI